MKMDIDHLTELVLNKFINSNGYSELDILDLHKVIHKHLTGFYKRKVHVANTKLNIKKIKGIEVSELEYEEAINNAQSVTIQQAYAIAATDHKDLKDLREMSKL